MRRVHLQDMWSRKHLALRGGLRTDLCPHRFDDAWQIDKKTLTFPPKGKFDSEISAVSRLSAASLAMTAVCPLTVTTSNPSLAVTQRTSKDAYSRSAMTAIRVDLVASAYRL